MFSEIQLGYLAAQRITRMYMTQVESLTVQLETELVLPLVFKPESRTWKARARCYGVCDRLSELQLGDADG